MTLNPLLHSSPPLSTAEAATYSNSRQLRLRKACDGCTAAKVKCNKGRPACQRCLETAELCQYSPSRRHGRRARSIGALKTPTPMQHPSLATTTTESTLIPTQPAQIEAESSLIAPQSADLWAWNNINLSSAGTDFGFSDIMTASFGSPDYSAQQDPNLLLNGKASSAGLELSEQEDDAMSFNTVGGLQEAVDASRDEIEHASECEARALNALKSLQYSPALRLPQLRESFSAELTPSATAETISQRPLDSVDSMDTLLARNKAALDELGRMLECRCANQPHIALLHSTILSKVVFWYKVAVAERYYSERVELKPISIQFDVLDLDDDDYAAVHRAVLGRELQKATNAIRFFEVRMVTLDVPVRNRQLSWVSPVIRAIREELERSIHDMK